MAMKGNRSNTDVAAFGKRLQAARLSKNFNKSELARRCGLSVPSIQKYEDGLASPAYYILFRLAEVLDVSPGWLALGIDDQERKAQIRRFADELNNYCKNNGELETIHMALTMMMEVWKRGRTEMGSGFLYSGNKRLTKQVNGITEQMENLARAINTFKEEVIEENKKSIERNLI